MPTGNALGAATVALTIESRNFPGYLRAYVEGSDDPEAELAEVVLVPVGGGHAQQTARLE